MKKSLFIFMGLAMLACGETGTKKSEEEAINWDEILPGNKSNDAKAVLVEDPRIPRFSNCYNESPKILIVDFNRGWWSGLGAGMSSYIIDDIKDNACPSGLDISYHYLKDDGQMTTELASFNKESFTQVWIFSDTLEGMSLAQSEVTTNLRKIASWNIPTFIASGDQRSEIANLYAKNFNLHSFFTDVYSGDTYNADLTKPIDRKTTINTLEIKSDLFKDTTVLLDEIVQDRRYVTKSTAIFTGLADNEILSTCNSGKGCISIHREKIILDSGFQRSYGALRSDFGKSTKNYLYNIVRYLHKQGR